MLGQPAIIGGDFNMGPRELAQSGFAEALKLKVIAPDEGARRPGERIIDYWLVGADFGAAYAKVLHGWNVAPHYPVQPTIDGAAVARRMQYGLPDALPAPYPIGVLRRGARESLDCHPRRRGRHLQHQREVASLYYQAEWNIADAMGLVFEYHKYSGRAQRPALKRANVTIPSPPRLPKVSTGATWVKSMAIAFEDTAQ
eukprot:1310595-Pyramimonas_sp.AAC.1